MTSLEDSCRFCQVGDKVTRSESLEASKALTVEAWVQSGDAPADAFQVLVSKWTNRTQMDAFESYDAGSTDGLDTKGFFGSVSDGRYVYFAPQLNASQQRHGQALRYDSHGPFSDPSSWCGYDAGHTSGLNTKGYYGAVHAGDYIYYVPRTDGENLHSRFLRYHRRGAFTDPDSWSAYDIGHQCSYQSAAFDGRYIYLVPGYDQQSGETGKAVRFDTRGAFSDPSSYLTYDAGNTDGLESTNYDGACVAGRYVYFAPLNNRGIVLRVDTQGQFADPASWSALDASGIGMRACVGAIFDGDYVYYVPYAHSVALRYDTRKDFKDPASWEARDALNTSGLVTNGYDGAAFDGRYIYYIPFMEPSTAAPGPPTGFHCRHLRYDTQKEFGDPSAWGAVDGSTLTSNPGGFNGGAFDGRYVYYTPWREDPGPNDTRDFTPHGKVLRYDTAADAAFILKFSECGHNGGLTASLPGPTFTLITADGTRSVRANRNVAPGWHHLCATYNGSAIALYINGDQVGQENASGTLRRSRAPVSVGAHHGGGGAFRGTIGEVKISNVAKSPQQVRAAFEHYRAGSSAT